MQTFVTIRTVGHELTARREALPIVHTFAEQFLLRLNVFKEIKQMN